MPTQMFKIMKLFDLFLADSKLEDELKKQTNFYGLVGQCLHLMAAGGIFPKYIPIKKKVDKESEQSRTNGNKYFVEQNYIEALRCYTEAVAKAKNDGLELALAYGNRSAATYALEEFHDSINDIDRSLNGKYPKHLKYKLLERKGKCLASLETYSKAIDSFKEALQALESSNLNAPTKSMKKTDINNEIEKICKNTDNKENISPNNCIYPEMSHPPSDYIQCASSAVDIEYLPAMGRLVTASTDLFPGNVIAIEKAFASILLPGSYNFFCYMCKKRCHSMIPCLHCTQVMFCNEDCRKTSWEKSHRIECSLLSTLFSLECDKMELLAVHVLMIVTNQGKTLSNYLERVEDFKIFDSPRERGFKDGKYFSDEEQSAYCLETNFSARTWNDMLPRIVMASCIVIALQYTSYFDYIQNEDIGLEQDFSFSHAIAGGIILQYLMSIPCNAHELSEMRIYTKEGQRQETESVEVGAGLFNFLSLINHSCDPNVVRHVIDGDVTFLTPLKVIKQGEQLYDNYGYHYVMHDIQTRQEKLCSQYYFVCKCIACIDNWPLYKDIPTEPVFLEGVDQAKINASLVTFYKAFLKLQSGQDIDNLLQCLWTHLTICHGSVQMPWRSYNDCQEVIKECQSRRASHYVFK